MLCVITMVVTYAVCNNHGGYICCVCCSEKKARQNNSEYVWPSNKIEHMFKTRWLDFNVEPIDKFILIKKIYLFLIEDILHSHVYLSCSIKLRSSIQICNRSNICSCRYSPLCLDDIYYLDDFIVAVYQKGFW
jgi:hypothetical protein